MSMVPARYQHPGVIQAALRESVIAIVGMSNKPARASHAIGQYLQSHRYRIIPVNPREQEVLGEACYPTLADAPGVPGVVNVFREPAAAPAIAQAAVAVGAKFLWLQLGVISEAAAEIAEAGGLQVIMDRCIKVEHARYPQLAQPGTG